MIQNYKVIVKCAKILELNKYNISSVESMHKDFVQEYRQKPPDGISRGAHNFSTTVGIKGRDGNTEVASL